MGKGKGQGDKAKGDKAGISQRKARGTVDHFSYKTIIFHPITIDRL